MNITVRTVELHLAVPFAISRATHTTKRVVLVELREGDRISRGEGVPDAFFGETPEAVERDVRKAIEALSEDPLDLDGTVARLEVRFPHGGAACCAVDVLAHDRASQAAGVTLRDFLGLAAGEPPPTSFTIGIAEPAAMAERASASVSPERSESIRTRPGPPTKRPRASRPWCRSTSSSSSSPSIQRTSTVFAAFAPRLRSPSWRMKRRCARATCRASSARATAST